MVKKKSYRFSAVALPALPAPLAPLPIAGPPGSIVQGGVSTIETRRNISGKINQPPQSMKSQTTLAQSRIGAELLSQAASPSQTDVPALPLPVDSSDQEIDPSELDAFENKIAKKPANSNAPSQVAVYDSSVEKAVVPSQQVPEISRTYNKPPRSSVVTKQARPLSPAISAQPKQAPALPQPQQAPALPQPASSQQKPEPVNKPVFDLDPKIASKPVQSDAPSQVAVYDPAVQTAVVPYAQHVSSFSSGSIAAAVLAGLMTGVAMLGSHLRSRRSRRENQYLIEAFAGQAVDNAKNALKNSGNPSVDLKATALAVHSVIKKELEKSGLPEPEQKALLNDAEKAIVNMLPSSLFWNSASSQPKKVSRRSPKKASRRRSPKKVSRRRSPKKASRRSQKKASRRRSPKKASRRRSPKKVSRRRSPKKASRRSQKKASRRRSPKKASRRSQKKASRRSQKKASRRSQKKASRRRAMCR